MTVRDAKSNIPWSVKGVSKEAREAAKSAAAEQGVTMGEWLTQAIRSGEQDLADVPRSVSTEAENHSVNDPPLVGQMPTVSNPADRLRAGISKSIAQSEERILGVVTPLQEIIQQMALRIEALESRHNQEPAALSAPAPHGSPAFRKTGWDD